MRTLLVSFGALAVMLIACETPDFEGDGIGGSNPTPESKTAETVACTGSATLTPDDPNKYPKCACAKGGAARCIPKDKVPASFSASLEACTQGGAGMCVPDAFVKSGGAAPPKCNSSFGEGRCMSLCVPEVGQNGSLLTRGDGNACAEDERCVPCKNPLKAGEDTGVCQIGAPQPASCTQQKAPAAPGGTGATNVSCPYIGPPLVDVTTFPSCGDGARCVPGNLVPQSAQAMLAKCDSGFCAPEKQIAAGGQYLPKTCKSVAGGEGRCTNVVIPAVAAQKTSLPQDVCDANERCTPCFDPLSGKETGACSTVSCDSPKQPKVTFAGCCHKSGTDQGKCVPTASVPASEADHLSTDSCVKGQELCAPAENLDPAFKPTQCQGSSFFLGDYTGVCVSDCIDLGFLGSISTSQGSCPNDHTCAPCEQFGSPTGAPGCP